MTIVVREGREADLVEVASMTDDFVTGHPAAQHPRAIETLRAALIGNARLAELVVATRRDRIVGMVQWQLFYDLFWAMRGARAEWLYVRPEARGQGIAAALIAEVCARARRAGADFLHGGGGDEVARLYARIAMSSTTMEFHLSAEAFHTFADLAGKPVREVVRGLPARELNRVAPRAR